ncbi:MAG TPA: DUF3108 domain-containing protein [Planctomycetota bacterium]|nr:DUF3108 domain-containing protein [Planctomycetota bacterium]
MALAISACAPAIRAQSKPAAEQRSESAAESVEPTAASEPAGPEPLASEPALEGTSEELLERRDAQLPAPAADKQARDAAAPLPEQLPAAAAAPREQPESGELWTLDRGEGNVPLMIPRHETLVYEVHLNLGWLGSPTVGKVTLQSETRPFYPSTPDESIGEQTTLTGRAEGSYKVYTLDNTISSMLLPQAWPRAVHRNLQTGSESRSRENWLGVVEGKETSRYRSDGHCKGCKNKAHYVSGSWPWSDPEHCKKCKRPDHRTWKDAKFRDVPPGTLDMLTAVYLARSLVIDGRPKVEFPLIDRDDLWQVQLSRGRGRRIETAAGKFDTVEVELRTGPPEGAAPGESTKFEGLFGIHGTISIWMDATSGVPVRIEGAVPAGPVDLDVTIDLRSARGAPRAFVSLRE